ARRQPLGGPERPPKMRGGICELILPLQTCFPQEVDLPSLTADYQRRVTWDWFMNDVNHARLRFEPKRQRSSRLRNYSRKWLRAFVRNRTDFGRFRYYRRPAT